MEITEIAASTSKKHQHAIIGDLLAFSFNDALEKSLVKKQKNNEPYFFFINSQNLSN